MASAKETQREGGAAEGAPRRRDGVAGGVAEEAYRLLLILAVLSSIVCALIGYATLGAHLHTAISTTCLLIAIAFLLHKLAADLLEAAAAPGSPSGIFVRRTFGLPADSTLRGQYLVLLVFDAALVLLLAVAIPAAWSVDTDAMIDGLGQLVRGVKVGGVTISLGNVGMAIVAFFVCMLLARLTRSVVRDRVMPTVDAPMPLRQSIDAGLNYAGVMIAILVGIGALGVDFTNLNAIELAFDQTPAGTVQVTLKGKAGRSSISKVWNVQTTPHPRVP